jgi:hypothetical protein
MTAACGLHQANESVEAGIWAPHLFAGLEHANCGQRLTTLFSKPECVQCQIRNCDVAPVVPHEREVRAALGDHAFKLGIPDPERLSRRPREGDQILQPVVTREDECREQRSRTLNCLALMPDTLDADALATPEREHIALVAMIALSTHGRIEAILELDECLGQIQDGLIFFNAPGRAQTKKRRSIVPIAPTLAPWLEGRKGRIIRAKRQRLDPETGEVAYVDEPTDSIKKAFKGCLIAAGITEIAADEGGEPVWLPPRGRLGETKPRLQLVGLGSPNTLRHTCSTEMHRRGVPEAQIDAAAGHAGNGTNTRHYRHLRPDYLQDFIAGVEAFWAEVGQHTDAHLRYHRDTKIIDLGARRPARGKNSG